jgi:putative endonuclease
VLQKSPNLKNNFGQKAENLACDLLHQNGYKIIDRNFHSRFGEIDIVALKDNTLIFVEVKARQSLKYGMPEEAVTRQKLYKIRRTGEYYSILYPELPKKLRIDVVALIIENGQVVSSKIIMVY